MTASLTNFISTSGVIKECKLQNALFSVQSTENPLFLLPFFEMRNFRKPYLAPPFVICLCIQSTIFLHSNTTTRKWLMVFWLTGKWSWQQIGLSGQSVSSFFLEKKRRQMGECDQLTKSQDILTFLLPLPLPFWHRLPRTRCLLSTAPYLSRSKKRDQIKQRALSCFLMDDISAFLFIYQSYWVCSPGTFASWPFLRVFLSLLYMIQSVLCLHNCTMHISTGLLLLRSILQLYLRRNKGYCAVLLVILSSRLLETSTELSKYIDKKLLVNNSLLCKADQGVFRECQFLPRCS